MSDPPARFWAKVDKNGPVSEHRPELGPCWIWTASTRNGYGAFSVGPRATRRVVQAHRFAYELMVGEIPADTEVDHLCRVHACVNPAHLEPVTHRENVLRGSGASARHAAQTHCINGHEFTPAATMVNIRGARVCRICKRRRDREYAARRR